jgi:hypothetical protein
MTEKCGSGAIGRTSVKTSLGVGVGLTGIGRADTFASGNMFADKVGGGLHNVDIEFGAERPNFGLRAGGSFGVEFGAYLNDKECDCEKK